jgi:hypothetical protein
LRKQELTKKIIDRVLPVCTKSAGAVLLRLIAITKVPCWKTSDIDGRYSPPTTNEKIGWFLHLHRHTVRAALRTLLDKGLITASTKERNSYTVNIETVESFSSTYRDSLAHTLGDAMLNAIRMKFHRHPDKTPKWASVHPYPREKCTCTGSFCSHPDAENFEELPAIAA